MWTDLSNLYLDRDAESRSLTAENPTGAVGKGAMDDPGGHGPARELGVGWKVTPCLQLKAGETATLMNNDGPGVVRHIWITFRESHYRHLILRIYWDGGRPALRRDALRRLHVQRMERPPEHPLHSHERQPVRRNELLLSDAVPQTCQDHR